MPAISYFNPYFRQDQNQPILITASHLHNKPIWEAIGVEIEEHAGTFVPRLDSLTTSTLTPLNRTQNVAVRVFDAKKPVWQEITPGVMEDGETIAYPSVVTPGLFYGARGNEAAASGDCFVEAVATGPMWARSLGLSRDADNNYQWSHPNYDFSLALGQIGLYSIWINGYPVMGVLPQNPVGYFKEGDIFRVAVENNTVCFRQNGRLVYRHLQAPPVNLYPIVSFFEATAQLSNVRFWNASYGKAEANLYVSGVLPVCQDKITEHEVTEIAEVSDAESMRGRDKVVRYHHQQDKWDLIFTGRRLEELQQMREFRKFHRIHVPFLLPDHARGIETYVVFDTGIKDRLIASNLFDFSCTVKEY